MKGKQKMVMQGVLKLLKSLVRFPLFASPSIFSRQAGDSQSFSSFGAFLVSHILLWDVLFLWGWCVFVDSCCQGLLVSSLVLFWLSSWKHIVQDFFFLVYVGSYEVGFWDFFKLDVFRQMYLRTNCFFQLSVKIKNWLYACCKRA